MRKKRDELMDEVKGLKAKLAAFDGIDADEVRKALESAKETETANLEAKGEYEKILKQVKEDYAKELEKITQKFESEAGFSRRLLTDGGLTDALAKANVRPEYMDAAKALLKDKVAIQGEGDERRAVIGDKALGDFVTEWAGSDQGKHFVSAPNSSGGGANGSGNGNGGAKLYRSEMSDKQKAEYVGQHGQAEYLKLPMERVNNG